MTTKSEGMRIPGKLKWYVLLALTLWLAFSGVAVAEQLYVNESGWWRDGGVFNASGAPIQAAVDAAGAGDAIYVHGGNYNENVDVDKPRLTLEGAGTDVVTVTAASSVDHVFYVTADWVNISGFAVRKATSYPTAGFYLYSVDHCNIYDNHASDNYCGIRLRYSSSNTLKNNTASNNDYGIYLYSSSNNTLKNNTASNSWDGIRLRYSSNNTLKNNIASNNIYGIHLDISRNNTLMNNTANSNNGGGIRMSSSSNNKLMNNTFIDDGLYVFNSYGTTAENNIINGKPLAYHEDASNFAIQNAGQVVLVNCINIAVENLNLSYTSVGIELFETNGCKIVNNTASNNIIGIWLSSSHNNTLTNNTALNNDNGIAMVYSSNSMLTNNTASNNDDGISLLSSHNNTLTNNTALNNKYGIYLSSSSNNNIACNWVQNNTKRGFYLSGGGTRNNISYNNIIENGNYNTETGGWEWQFYNDQPDPVEAKHNYWGAGMNNSTIDASIYDNEEGGWGEVEFYPFETEPVPCAPTPEEPHIFTTTDTVIALQIAAGSRPLDLGWDVSGDKRVTSLDALMILQAAADAIYR